MADIEPCLHVVTLGVSEFERSLHFYSDGLGWKRVGHEDDVAFFPTSGMVLALYPRHLLAADANIAPGDPSSFGGVTLAQCLASRQLVDEMLAKAAAAGASILKPAGDTFWGDYSGYFADPDGYPWEIARNPLWTLLPDGGVELPVGPASFCMGWISRVCRLRAKPFTGSSTSRRC